MPDSKHSNCGFTKPRGRDVEQELPKEHPLRALWSAYKATDEYANTRRWALHEGSVDGSLWAAFSEGLAAACQTRNTSPLMMAAAGLHLPSNVSPGALAKVVDAARSYLAAWDSPHVSDTAIKQYQDALRDAMAGISTMAPPEKEV